MRCGKLSPRRRYKGLLRVRQAAFDIRLISVIYCTAIVFQAITGPRLRSSCYLAMAHNDENTMCATSSDPEIVTVAAKEKEIAKEVPVALENPLQILREHVYDLRESYPNSEELVSIIETSITTQGPRRAAKKFAERAGIRPYAGFFCTAYPEFVREVGNSPFRRMITSKGKEMLYGVRVRLTALSSRSQPQVSPTKRGAAKEDWLEEDESDEETLSLLERCWPSDTFTRKSLGELTLRLTVREGTDSKAWDASEVEVRATVKPYTTTDILDFSEERARRRRVSRRS